MFIRFIALFCAFFLAQAFAADCSPDFTGKDILYIGDSVSTPVYNYGDPLKAALAQETNATVVRYAIGTTASLHWTTGFGHPFFQSVDNTLCDTRAGRTVKTPAPIMPGYSKIVEGRSPPRATVIALGTNDMNNYCATILASAKKAGKRPQEMLGAGDFWFAKTRELAQLAGGRGRACVWVIPFPAQRGEIVDNCSFLPNGAKTAFDRLRKAVSGSCRIVDSGSVCSYVDVGFDSVGMHPMRGAEKLGACVGKAVGEAIRDFELNRTEAPSPNPTSQTNGK